MAFKIVEEDEDLIIITDNGMVIRIPINQISTMGRVTQGVKLINLKEEQIVTAVFNVKNKMFHVKHSTYKILKPY